MSQNPHKTVMMELRPQEAELILRIRHKYRFGEILVETRDGLPMRVGKTTVYESLAVIAPIDVTDEDISKMLDELVK